MKTYPEYKIVKECLLLIEKQLNWGDSTLWHNDVFIELSEKIQEKTKVILSPTTLKRVWGRINYDNAPSISTLNSLAHFAGFSNWREFKNQSTIKKPSWVERKISPNLSVIVVSAALLTVAFISFYSMIGGVENKVEEFDTSAITFKSKSVSKGLPCSVVFDFNLKNINSDSLYIQQYWDPRKTIKINKEQTQATGQYYFPGYFRAKLLVDGTIVKEHDLFIKTEGWLGTIDYKPIPKYITEKDLMNGSLSFHQSIIDEIEAREKPIVTIFHRIEQFKEISGDNFVLNTSIRNVYREKWAVCQKAVIAVSGTKSALMIPFSIPGCASELGLMLSEKNISGKKHDLSSLGIDLSTFKDIQIKTVNKNITIFVEDTAVYSNHYTKSIGDIVGVQFYFLGAGEVKNVSIKNLIGDTILLDEKFDSDR